MTQQATHTVTGITGYTGRHIAAELIEQGCRIRSITGHPERPNPFGDRAELHPFNFDRPGELVRTLRGTDTLFNTYWIRLNHRGQTFDEAVRRTRTMFWAAREAGVRRIVHISVTNADSSSGLPYFRGKGQLEETLRELEGISHAILRPALLFGHGDILLNNIAWALRTFPVMLLPGRGDYGVQPAFVGDLAGLAAEHARGDRNLETDVVGPEHCSYAGMVSTIREKIGARCLLLPSPPRAAHLAALALGAAKRDIVLSMDEIRGLTQGLVASRSETPAVCPTSLTEWLEENGGTLGRTYANDAARHCRT